MEAESQIVTSGDAFEVGHRYDRRLDLHYHDDHRYEYMLGYRQLIQFLHDLSVVPRKKDRKNINNLKFKDLFSAESKGT